VGQRFLAFCDSFADHFRTRTRDISVQATQYLSGLIQARRKNMERMTKVVPESNDHVAAAFPVQFHLG
jgi:hypothetical protein